MSASLIEQLQIEAIQRSAPITDLLRKTKLVAAKLGSSELSTWAEHELNGYFDIRTEGLPSYRQLRGEIKWMNPYRGWQSLGLDVTMPCVHPIGELLGLIDNDSGFITASIPTEFAQMIRQNLNFPADVKFHASCAALKGVIEGARNAVLDWALKLDQAGVRGEGVVFSPVETQRAQAVHINIGSIGNAVGLGAFGNDASITAYQQTDVRHLAARSVELANQVERQLANAGLPTDIVSQTRSALVELRAASEEPTPQIGRLTSALGAIQRVMEGATGNLVATGVAALITKILSGQ